MERKTIHPFPFSSPQPPSQQKENRDQVPRRPHTWQAHHILEEIAMLKKLKQEAVNAGVQFGAAVHDAWFKAGMVIGVILQA